MKLWAIFTSSLGNPLLSFFVLQRGALGPTAGRRTPPAKARGSAHVLWQSPRWPLHAWEAQRLGGPVPQGSLSDR